MKNTLYKLQILIFVLTTTLFWAQDKTTQKADKLFQRLEYVKAAKAYEKLAEGKNASPYVYKQLADSYYYTFKTEEAAQWYKKALETPQEPETHFRYAQVLRAQNKQAEADKQMQLFAQKAPNDSRAKAFKLNPNFMASLLNKKEAFVVKPSTLNDETSDFGLILFDGVGYFTSARNSSRKTYGWTKEPFTDIYSAPFNKEDFTFGTPELFEALSTKHNDGPICFSPDGNTAYFASESWLQKQYLKDDLNLKQGQVHLFKATKTPQGWSDVQALPFNGNGFSCANPALSADGKTLYFSSNKPGGFGGIDIWQVSVNGDSFGEPVNLGEAVNTPSDESFPFIAQDNKTLYFSSKGHQGFGAYDVFAYDMASKTIKNLGKPINSERDDFGFSYYPTLEVGFLASNRAGGDDLYVATPVCGVVAEVVVTNKITGASIANAQVTLVDDKNNTLKRAQADASGKVSFELDCNTNYGIQATASGFDPGAFAINAAKGGVVNVTATLEPIEPTITDTEVILKPIFFEYDKSDITEEGAAELDKLVKVMNDYPEMVIFAKSHTDNRGSQNYNLNLSKRRAKSTVAYLISKGINKNRISGDGFGKDEPKVDCGEECTEEEHALNRRSEFLIVKQ